MHTEEFEQLKRDVVTLIKESIIDKNDLRDFEDGIAKFTFLNLPKHKEVIKTCNGILGFKRWCDQHNETNQFMFNASHDMVECAKNYNKKWFSPRLSRYAVLS